MPAVRIAAADAGYSLPVVTAGEKVFSNSLDPFEAKLPEIIGILLIIPATEIGEMTLKDLVEGVSSPRKVLGLLLFQYGSILYAHIKYYCENGTDASEKTKKLKFNITWRMHQTPSRRFAPARAQVMRVVMLGGEELTLLAFLEIQTLLRNLFILKALVFDDLSFLQPVLGQIALLIFLSIIGLTLLFMVPGLIHRFQPVDALRVFVNRRLGLDYSVLKIVHNLLAGAFAVLLIHVFLASSTGETLFRILFMALWGGVALSLWVYHKLIRPLFLHARSLRVSSVMQHSDTVTEIRMVSPSGALPRYRAGQFAFFRFPASAVGGEEHPFTLSSSPHESFISITAKDLGNYTGKLRLLKEGDSAHLDGPYGLFTLDPEEKGPLLFIAGGIGITPFYSIIKTIAGDDDRTIFLFWAVRKRKDLIYDADFRALASRIKNFHYIPVLSDEEPRDSEEKGFITSDLLRKYCTSLASCRVYFCGPQVMRRLLFRELGKEGVPEKKIRYEQFSLG